MNMEPTDNHNMVIAYSIAALLMWVTAAVTFLAALMNCDWLSAWLAFSGAWFAWRAQQLAKRLAAMDSIRSAQ